MATRQLDYQGYVSAQDPRTMPGSVTPPVTPSSITDIRNNSGGGVGNTASQVPQAQGDQFASIINLLKQYQQGGQTTLNQAQQGQIQRGISTDQGLIGASPSQQSASRNASVNALEPTIGGAKDVINQAQKAIADYQTAQQQAKATAQDVVHQAIGAGSDAVNSLIESQPDLLKQAGYDVKTLQGVSKSLKKQEDQAAYKTYGGGTGGGGGTGSSTTQYVPGDNPTVDSWVQNINSGKAKLSDISGNPGLKNLVSQGLAQAHSSTDTVLNTTKASLKELNDMVNNNQGFSGAVGAKGLSSLFGLKSQPIAGTQAANFDAKLKQVINDQVLPNLAVLKGLGRVTQTEFQTLQTGLTSLSPNLSESAFKTELKNITDRINNISNAPSDHTNLVGPDGKTYSVPNDQVDAFIKAGGHK